MREKLDLDADYSDPDRWHAEPDVLLNRVRARARGTCTWTWRSIGLLALGRFDSPASPRYHIEMKLGWVLVLSACAHDVAQDRATGPDGKIKGATPIALENGAGKVKGIVTYPGGDRVDWKVLELPAGKHGTLDLKLSFATPRPGLQVAFDVFDQWNTPIAAAKGKRGHVRTASIDNASGKYFVRVYAPRRSDAGVYRLEASFEPALVAPPVTVEIPEPPWLPAVPDPDPVCEPFDINNKACHDKCPDFGAPPGWPPCAEKEKAAKEQAEREEAEKHKPPPPKPVIARVLHTEVTSDGVIVTLGIGTESVPALDRSWSAQVLSTATGNPLVGGGLVIRTVGKTQTTAKSTLTTDQLGANLAVRLSPGPRP